MLVLCRWEKACGCWLQPLSLLRSPVVMGLGIGQSLPCWLPAFLGPDPTPEAWVLRTHTGNNWWLKGKWTVCSFVLSSPQDPRLPWRNPWLILTLEAPPYHQLSDPCPLSPTPRRVLMLGLLHGMRPPAAPLQMGLSFSSKPSPLTSLEFFAGGIAHLIGWALLSCSLQGAIGAHTV